MDSTSSYWAQSTMVSSFKHFWFFVSFTYKFWYISLSSYHKACLSLQLLLSHSHREQWVLNCFSAFLQFFTILHWGCSTDLKTSSCQTTNVFCGSHTCKLHTVKEVTTHLQYTDSLCLPKFICWNPSPSMWWYEKEGTLVSY